MPAEPAGVSVKEVDAEQVVIKTRVPLFPRFTAIGSIEERSKRADNPTLRRGDEPDILKVIAGFADASALGAAYPRFSTICRLEDSIL